MPSVQHLLGARSIHSFIETTRLSTSQCSRIKKLSQTSTKSHTKLLRSLAWHNCAQSPDTTPLVCGVFLYLHLKGTPWQWRHKHKHNRSIHVTNPPRSQHSKLYKNHESTGTTPNAGASDTNAFTAPQPMPCGKTRSTVSFQTFGNNQTFRPSSDKYVCWLTRIIKPSSESSLSR